MPIWKKEYIPQVLLRRGIARTARRVRSLLYRSSKAAHLLRALRCLRSGIGFEHLHPFQRSRRILFLFCPRTRTGHHVPNRRTLICRHALIVHRLSPCRIHNNFPSPPVRRRRAGRADRAEWSERLLSDFFPIRLQVRGNSPLFLPPQAFRGNRAGRTVFSRRRYSRRIFRTRREPRASRHGRQDSKTLWKYPHLRRVLRYSRKGKARQRFRVRPFRRRRGRRTALRAAAQSRSKPAKSSEFPQNFPPSGVRIPFSRPKQIRWRVVLKRRVFLCSSLLFPPERKGFVYHYIYSFTKKNIHLCRISEKYRKNLPRKKLRSKKFTFSEKEFIIILRVKKAPIEIQ